MPETKTLPAKLLDLTLEYADATRRAEWGGQFGTFDSGRTPERIAAEYGDTLREFLSKP